MVTNYTNDYIFVSVFEHVQNAQISVILRMR